ncbi:DUF2931 family protein [Serratia proteamaculans]
MEIKRIAGMFSVLILAACQGTAQSNKAAQNTEPTEWAFSFFTPKGLPALVTFAAILDTGNIDYRFNTLDSTPALDNVIGEWNNRARPARGHWNRITSPPRHILFCWDSVIDKKVYETHLTLSDAAMEKMRRPSVYKNYLGKTAYYDSIQIGLAPEGKAAVWLDGIGFEPNYRVTPAVLKTVSGDKLALCKGITRHPNGYKYYGDTPEFIKDKVYPYGVW